MSRDFFRTGGGGGGSPPQGDRFNRSYACYPVSFVGKEELEKGNKILLPQSALSALARMNVSWPMLFKLTNTTLGRCTHVGVLEFSAEEGTCYLPYWVMRNLMVSEGDLLQVENVSLEKGTFVKLQPVSKDFLTITDHRALLEHSLSHFAALTKGDFILIKHGRRDFEIEILDCKPQDAVSVIETDVQVDFAPPKDYVEEERPSPSELTQSTVTATATNITQPVGATTSPSKFTPFSGVGKRLDGTQPTTAERPKKLPPNHTKPWLNRLPGGVRVR